MTFENMSMTTYEKLQKNGLYLNPDDVERICKQYRIIELSIFGSSLRDDFREDSDVDILVSFIKKVGHSLFNFMDAEQEFERLLNREIDLVEIESLKYPERRANILLTREIIYMINRGDDAIFLMDIVECCLKIIETTKNTKYYYFEKDFQKKSTVERQIEIIGEASKKISTKTREELAHIPWKKMIGLRNVIAHEYRDIVNEVIWKAAIFFVPELLNNLYKIEDLKNFIDQEKVKFKKTKDMEFQ